MVRPLSERKWQAQVVQVARLHGWWVYHTYDSRRSQPGLPDLILVRERVVFAELKTDTGRLTPDQRACLDALQAAGAEVYVWRPRDFELISPTLRRSPSPAASQPGFRLASSGGAETAS
jgi:hypothetical protein